MTISSNVYKDEDDIMAQLIVYHRHASIIIGIKTQAGIINIYIYTYLEPILMTLVLIEKGLVLEG